MSLIGTTTVTQGPQGTVSSIVMEDGRKILKCLCDIKDLLDRFDPSLTTKFSIKSLLVKIPTSKQIWGTMINIFGDRGNSAKIFGIKGTRAKNIFGNKGFY